MALKGLVKCGPMTALTCPVDQVKHLFGWLLGQGILPEIIRSAIWRGMAKGMRWRVWAVLKTCQRCNNLLRESISVVNYPCDQNESPTVSLKCLCLSNLCPLHPVLFSADMDSRLFPSSLQYPAIHLSHFVLALQYFCRSSNQVVLLFPWRPRNPYLRKPQGSSSRPSSLSSHPHVDFRPNRPRKKGADDTTRNLPVLPPPCYMGRKPNGHIHSSSPKK